MRTKTTPRSGCIVCSRHGLTSTDTQSVVMCTKCVHPEQVRTYCSKCHKRLVLSFKEAKELFVDTNSGVPIERTGSAILYDQGCPSCTEHAPLPRIFYISSPDPFMRSMV